MCYSEKLKREAGAHMVEGAGWLLVGYKAVRPPAEDEGEPGTWWSLHGVPQECGYNEAYQYPIRKLLADDHGYHLAATPEGAWDAARRIIAKQPHNIEQVQICRVLVPEDCVEADHHAHEVYVLAPGEHESAEDLKRASRGLRRRAKLRAWRCEAARRLLAAATVRAPQPAAEPAGTPA